LINNINNHTNIISEDISDFLKLSFEQQYFLALMTASNVIGFSGYPFYEDIFKDGKEISTQEVFPIIYGIISKEHVIRANRNGVEEIILKNGTSLFKYNNPITTTIKKYAYSIKNPEDSLCVLSIEDIEDNLIKTISNQEPLPPSFIKKQGLSPLAVARIEFINEIDFPLLMMEELIPYIPKEKIKRILRLTKKPGLTLYLAEIVNNNQQLAKSFFLDMIRITLEKLNIPSENEQFPKQLIYYTREGVIHQ
jgi:hypothetical protein